MLTLTIVIGMYCIASLMDINLGKLTTIKAYSIYAISICLIFVYFPEERLYLIYSLIYIWGETIKRINKDVEEWVRLQKQAFL